MNWYCNTELKRHEQIVRAFLRFSVVVVRLEREILLMGGEMSRKEAFTRTNWRFCSPTI